MEIGENLKELLELVAVMAGMAFVYWAIFRR